MPSATVAKTFWLCSILLASSLATSSTSSVCWRTRRPVTSSPEALDTTQALATPARAAAINVIHNRRCSSGPGVSKPESIPAPRSDNVASRTEGSLLFMANRSAAKYASTAQRLGRTCRIGASSGTLLTPGWHQYTRARCDSRWD
ncbi:hypothetical protein SDC9_156613 [bioreactor metagenome]|uniref:Uncharacterized protein n=1 Tax=bioreactor metagenome TaxID=1076179 RepID=A0A645F9S8_9ZZZZ